MTATSDDRRPEPGPAGVAAARFQIPIARGLLAGFGGLVLLAIVAVLAVGLWSARENTFDLLRDRSEATVGLLLTRIEQYLKPAEDQILHLGRRLESGEIDAASNDDVGKALAGALAATPQIYGLALIRVDGRTVSAIRRPDGATLSVSDASGDPATLSVMESARVAPGLFWGDAVWYSAGVRTLLNARYPVRREHRYVGVLAAGVRADTLSALLEDTARTLGGSAFALYDGDFVLAHPKLAAGAFALDADNPLPTVAQLGDPVVSAARRGPDGADPDAATARRDGAMEARRGPGAVSDLEARTGIRIVEIGDERIALLSRTVWRYGDRPWLVGVHFPAVALTDELERLRWAAIAGGVVLLAALAAAWAMARTLAAPFGRLAVAAEQVRDLALDRVRPLPGSLFAEVTAADRAFNAMVIGLRWFETYVPRALVRRLVRQGENVATRSVGREATVMFTDIAGFTRRSETMSAEETAGFLNGHFAMLAGCVEAEGGTIDKFIGDAVMAFWDAPDHALRACRAALAMRAAVDADNARRRAEGASPVRLRVGLHTGPVVVGNIGAPGRINYTIVGDTVNTANRIEQFAREMGSEETDVAIALGGATVEAAGGAVRAVPAGVRPVRGREGEIALHRL